MDHPNVVKLYEIFDEDDCMYLVLELMSGGEVTT
jgi:serine/threonine protein kinase